MSPHTLISSVVYDRTVTIYLIISNEQLFDGGFEKENKKIVFIFITCWKSLSLAPYFFFT